jgi:aspartyl protease family protein
MGPTLPIEADGVRTFLVVCTVGFLAATAVQKLRERVRPEPAASVAPASLAAASVSAAAVPATANPALAGVALQAGRNGHFFVNALLDGRALPMMVDTGASLCAVSEEDAGRIGIRVGPGDFTRAIGTANGQVRVAPVRIAVMQIGSITVRDVEAVVVPRGLLSTSLLGMSFLRRLRDFSVTDGTMTLRG